MSDASKLLEGKINLPTELRTKEMAMLPQWLRERAFYMAAVPDAEILDAFRSEAAAITAGTRGIAESRRRLEDFLSLKNYQPSPGQEGTIKDLSAMQRIHTSLRTNADLLQGWGQKERGAERGRIMAFPAWELVRYKMSMVPRIWQERWLRAGGSLPGGRMIALKDDDIWEALGNEEDDCTGTDYPPFAYNSGMGWLPVPYLECKALGLLKDWTPPPRKPVSSPNETLQSTPRISTQMLRDELESKLKGLAEWQDDKLVFTDPNGTRKLAPEKLVQVWDKGMPDEFKHLPGNGLIQRQAAIDWTSAHADFEKSGNTDAWDDLLRLQGRIVSPPVDELWRGISLSNDDLGTFLRGTSDGVYSVRDKYPLESWTKSSRAAQRYANTSGQRWSVLLNVRNPKTAADFSPLVRSFADEVSKKTNPPVTTESEWVYPTQKKFRVLRTKKDSQTRTVRMDLEEIQ